MADPSTEEMKACCHVSPTAINDEATFHPAMPNMLDSQNSGMLYHVHVRSSGGVGSKSLFDHLVPLPSLGRPSGAGGALRKSTRASLEEKGAVSAALLGRWIIIVYGDLARFEVLCE